MIKCIVEENAFTNALADIRDGDIDMSKAKEYTKEDIEGIIKELETDAMDIELLFDRISQANDRLYYIENERVKRDKQIEEIQMWIKVLDRRVNAIMHKLKIDD